MLKGKAGPANQKAARPKRNKSEEAKYFAFVKRNKTRLEDILNDGLELILSKMLEKDIITLRQYTEKKRGGRVVDLMDLLLTKGAQTCQDFVNLVYQDPEIVNTFPQLSQLQDQLNAQSPLPPRAQNCSDGHGGLRNTPNSSPASGVGGFTPGSEPPQQPLCGYVHKVTKQKESKGRRQYFSAQLQCREQTWTVMVFDLAKREVFISAEQDKRAVQLDRVKFVDGQNIWFKDLSSISFVQEGSLPFSYDVSLDVQTLPLEQLLNSHPDEVNVHIAAMQMIQVGHLPTKAGEYLQRVEWKVADRTAAALLTLWEKPLLSGGEWYDVTNVKVDFYMGKLRLQTTRETEVTVVKSTHIPYALPSDSAIPENVVLKISCVQLDVKHCCPRRHLQDGACRGKFITCKKQNCKMKFSCMDLKRVVSGRLHVRDSERVLDLQDYHIRELLGNKIVDDSQSTKNALETALLKIQTVSVCFYKENILSMTAST